MIKTKKRITKTKNKNEVSQKPIRVGTKYLL